MGVADLKKRILNWDKSVSQKILYFGVNLRGTTQYWGQRAEELRSLVQFKINEGNGLPSFFSQQEVVQNFILNLSKDYFLCIFLKQQAHQ